MRTDIQLQVIATDVDNERIGFAKKGLYSKHIGNPLYLDYSGVSPERLNRFFDERINGYQVKDDLRQMIEFSQHDLVDDPPFTNISFIVSIWLIQWFDHEVQKKAIRNLFGSLLPNGVVFLNFEVFNRKGLYVKETN